jgi:hypothetical protein
VYRMTTTLRMIKNRFEVPAMQWGAWSDQAKGIFNRLYPAMKMNPGHYQVPGVEPIDQIQWEEICWNTAWAAADYTQRFSK